MSKTWYVLVVLFLLTAACAKVNHSNTGVWHNNTQLSHPSARTGASAVTTVNDTWIVFGGGDEYNFFNDLYSYDLRNPNIGWKKLDVENSPSKRAYHSAVIIDNKIYVFGGFDKTTIEDNAVYELDLSQQKLSWRSLTSSNAPQRRFSHSAVVSNGKMYIFGGITSDSKLLNDLYEYTPSTNTWKAINSQNIPTARAGHAHTEYNNKMYIFGGIVYSKDAKTMVSNETWSLDLTTFKWTLVQTKPSESTGKWPAPRVNSLHATFKENLWIFGGQQYDSSGKMIATNDLWVLSLEGYTWNEAINIRPKIAPNPTSCGVTAITPGTQAFNIFGGEDGKDVFDSQWFFIVLQ